jgi:YfiH family protein
MSLHPSNNESKHFIKAHWPAPKNVQTLITTRQSGFSQGVYNSFNLAKHVGDNVIYVDKNRIKLGEKIGNNIDLLWLNQTHSNRCVEWRKGQKKPNADACFTNLSDHACIVMTADCLPILLTNKQGNWVAACHAGWKGLADGVIQNTLAQYRGNKSDLIAWIGPAISQMHFEVGSEVRDRFISHDKQYQTFFKVNARGRYQFDFVGLAKLILINQGVKCYGGEHCSFADTHSFYSYRRDGETGRMASLIWFK